MDIFKILTRGIQHGPAGARATVAPTNLPSAGNRPNAQLFHDATEWKHGIKRKRGKATQPVEEAEDDIDIDFFAPKAEPSFVEAVKRVPDSEPTSSVAKKSKTKLLKEKECRQILQSHRLKFTVLSGQVVKQIKPVEEQTTGEGSGLGRPEGKRDDKPRIYPQPLSAFQELEQIYGISPRLAENVAKEGFREPTEVQLGSLPLLLNPGIALQRTSEGEHVQVKGGVDFLAVAPTGSGKTITFLIPAIMDVIKGAEHEIEGDHHKLSAIVVVPTRELATQIVGEGRKLALGTGVRIYPMKAGIQLSAQVEEEQVDEVDNVEDSSSHYSDEDESDAVASTIDIHPEPKRTFKPHILVTTPKSLLDYLGRGKARIRRSLPTVTSLILDEADVLLDPLFQKQTIGIWEACSNPNLQVSFWSATMASNIETLIQRQLGKQEEGRIRPPLVRLVVGLKDTAVPNVAHKLVYTASEAGKLLALRQLLHPSSSSVVSDKPLRPPFLVFTQTVERAQALYDELAYDIPLEAGGSARRIALLHSTLRGGARARSKSVARFRSGEVWVLITTDVLARGIDFRGVNGVVSYDVPGSAAAYVHRAGRTGRAGREGGVAITFYTKDDIPFVRSIANVIAASERQAGREGTGGVQPWLLDALPKVAKADKRRLKVRGVEARRTSKGKWSISTKSGWERRREQNRIGAIEASRRRKEMRRSDGSQDRADDAEWNGLDD